MRYRALFKDFLKELWNTRTRFVSILLIVALGCGFFAGLKSTGISMKETLNQYLEDVHYMDVEVMSNYGLTEDDISELRKVDGITQLAPLYQTDVLLEYHEANEVVRFHSYAETDFMQQFELVEGRMPEKLGECLIEKRGNSDVIPQLGDSFRVTSGNENDLEDFLKTDSYTVVGTVTSPMYFAVGEEKSLIGSGTVRSYVFLPKEDFSMEAYASALLKTDVPATDTFSATYQDHISPITDEIEALARIREPIRHAEFEDKITEAQQELEDGRKEGEEKIADAKIELADAEKKLADGEVEYADGLQEFNDEIAKARQELADAKIELEDGEVEYVDAVAEFHEEIDKAEQELADAKVQLEDGEKEYHKGRNEYLDGFRDYKAGLDEFRAVEREVRPQLSAAKKQLDQAALDMEAGQAELAESKAQLDFWKSQLEEGEQELETQQELLSQGQEELGQVKGFYSLLRLVRYQGDSVSDEQVAAAMEASEEFAPGTGLDMAIEMHVEALRAGVPSPTEAALDMALDMIADEIDQGEQELAHGQSLLDQGRAELEEQWQQYRGALSLYEEGKAEFDAGKAEYEAQLALYHSGIRELDSAQKTLDAADSELSVADYKLTEAQQELRDGKQEYEDGLVELADAKKEGEEKLADAKQELEDGWEDYQDGLIEFEEERQKGLQELADAKEEIEDGKKELADAKVTLADSEQELVETIAENQEKIDDAREEVDKITEIKWSITSRDKKRDISEFESNTQTIDAISKIFPLFFLAIAALVSLTTMTRMVEDQRTQVGTLKALGYSNLAIATKFIGYAILASSLGAVLGLVIGFQVFPKVIFGAFTSILYPDFPPILTPFRWDIAIITGVAAVLTTALSSFFASHNMLKESAASLLRPESPKPGKRILLERITPIWNRLTFNQKVTTRNLFRYKRRMLMSIVGIAGCAALTLAGFGLDDAIGEIVVEQFNTITHYDMEVILDEDAEDYTAVNTLIAETPEIENSLLVSVENGEIFPQNGVNKTQDVSVTTYQEGSDITDFISMRDSSTGQPLELLEDKVIITEKLSRLYGLSVGDTITVWVDSLEYELPIGAVQKNYTFHYIYMGEDLHRELFGKDPVYNREFITLDQDSALDKGFTDTLSTAFIGLDDVLTVMLTSSIVDSTANLTDSLATIILVLIFCSGLLAFIVMYNLTNINIAERQHEIATLKVLGFTDREVSSHVSNENIILSVIGSLVGLVVGVWLTRFVVNTAEVDNILFVRHIKPQSFLYAFAITMIFTIIVRIISHFQLKKIDMIESLHSGE